MEKHITQRLNPANAALKGALALVIEQMLTENATCAQGGILTDLFVIGAKRVPQASSASSSGPHLRVLLAVQASINLILVELPLTIAMNAILEAHQRLEKVNAASAHPVIIQVILALLTDHAKNAR